MQPSKRIGRGPKRVKRDTFATCAQCPFRFQLRTFDCDEANRRFGPISDISLRRFLRCKRPSIEVTSDVAAGAGERSLYKTDQWSWEKGTNNLHKSLTDLPQAPS